MCIGLPMSKFGYNKTIENNFILLYITVKMLKQLCMVSYTNIWVMINLAPAVTCTQCMHDVYIHYKVVFNCFIITKFAYWEPMVCVSLYGSSFAKRLPVDIIAIMIFSDILCATNKICWDACRKSA